MALENNLTSFPIDKPVLLKRMLLGAAIAFALMVLFLSGVNNANPEWGKYWMVRPLIIMPLAGATGGACFYFLDHITPKGDWRKPLAYFLSVLIFVFGLWMGTVLGLVGTLWN